MKTTLGAIGLLSLLSVQALGADLPLRQPPTAPAPVAVSVNWTGCSVGAAVGYGWHKSSVPIAAVNEGDYNGGRHTAKGGLFGARVGCDYQFSRVVVGAQGSADFMNMKGMNWFYPNQFREFLPSKVSMFTTATVRAGFLVTPDLLIYAKGGSAWLRTKHTDLDGDNGGVSFIGTTKTTRSGFVLGGGAEYALTDRWFAGVEYSFADFGTKTQILNGVAFPGTADIPITWKNRYDTKFQALTVGLRYKFF